VWVCGRRKGRAPLFSISEFSQRLQQEIEEEKMTLLAQGGALVGRGRGRRVKMGGDADSGGG